MAQRNPVRVSVVSASRLEHRLERRKVLVHSLPNCAPRKRGEQVGRAAELERCFEVDDRRAILE